MKTVEPSVWMGLRQPLDVFAWWRKEQLGATDRSRRLDDAVDLAVWKELAPRYDVVDEQTRQAPTLVDRVLELIPAGASVLDIGAGTGNYAIPLARHGSRVTALEYSPDMLAVLRRKLEEQGVQSVTPVQGKWEDTTLPPHDYVLAANCLYRVLDLDIALERFSALAKRQVLIVFSIGTPAVLLNWLSQALGRGPFYTGGWPIHVVLGLQALGVLPWVEPFRVQRTARYPSLEDAARQLGRPLGLNASVLSQARAVLAELLTATPQGWEYTYQATVALIYWNAGEVRGS